jgi:RimJ/RimL family protein N-acetyltransferase
MGLIAVKSIETSRLRLDPWTDEHTSMLIRLSAIPEVVRYVGTGETWSRSRAEEVAMTVRREWAERGFGWRTAIEKATGLPIGLIALNLLGDGAVGLDPGEYEIGWWLDPEAWGHGFAREGAAALLAHAFTTLGAPSVVARIQSGNRRSIRVAEALGLVRDFETTGRKGEPIVIYRGASVNSRLAPNQQVAMGQRERAVEDGRAQSCPRASSSLVA